MGKYRNISGINQFIEEHRRTIGPNEEIELSEEEIKSRTYAKGLAKGGWLIPVLENIVSQSVVQTLDNELDHVTGQPEQPFNINIPIGGIPYPSAEVSEKKSLSPQDAAIQEAVARAKVKKQKEAEDNHIKSAIKRALGGYNDEDEYVHNPVEPGQYGNIEHNSYNDDVMNRIVLPPDIGEGVAKPSAALEAAADRMYESQQQMYKLKLPKTEVHMEKEAVKSPKVIPSKVVKKSSPKSKKPTK